MKKKYKKLEMTMGNFLLREGLLYSVGVENMSGRKKSRRKQLWSLLLLLGLGTLACVFCYSIYFPGVVWISPRTSANHVPLGKRPGFQHNRHLQQSSSASLKLKSWWNFFSTKTLPEEMDGSGQDVQHLSSQKKETVNENGDEGTRACNFPRLNPFDPSIKEFIKEPANVDCFAKHPLIFRTDFQQKLIQVKKIVNATCCYKTVSRGEGSDQNIKYSKQCYNIVESETEVPPNHEFISIKCTHTQPPNKTTGIPTTTTVHKDIFAFVPLKPSVEMRIKNHFQELYTKPMFSPLKSRSSSSNFLRRSSEPQTPPPGEPSSVEDSMSILILGLDAQSHMNFIRQMPLTYNFLVKNLSAIGLYGYTKVGDNTFPNVIPLLSGLSVNELRKKCWPTKLSYFDECPFIWKEFARHGYRTSFAEDSIWMGTFNYEKKGFQNPPTDYYFHPLSLLMAKKIGHETWGNAKLCYGPRLAFEVLLDYIVKTAVTFHGSNNSSLYFQYVWANSLFHDYLNNPKLGDELLYLTLEYLSRQGYLNKTLFILLSDHGMRWGSIRSTYQGKIEERMPLAYFAFPQSFRDKYSRAWNNLVQNAYRLTTPFDIHETLRDLLDLKRISNEQLETSRHKGHILPKGISLFQNIPLRRTCKMAGIEEHWCVCNSMKEVSKTSMVVDSAARFIVTRINEELKAFAKFCVSLSLGKVNEAMRKIDGDVDRGVQLELNDEIAQGSTPSSRMPEVPLNNLSRVIKTDSPSRDIRVKTNTTNSIIQLQISLVTKPNDAVFEATVHGSVDGHSWSLSGEISRLNLYREQSLCINDPVAQKYCFCIDQLASNQE